VYCVPSPTSFIPYWPITLTFSFPLDTSSKQCIT